MSDIDALEQQLVRDLRKAATSPKFDKVAENIVYSGALLSKSNNLSTIFGGVAENKSMLEQLHAYAHKAKQIYDVKGDACEPEAKEFIDALKTMSDEDFNNPVAFAIQTILKARIEKILKPNPFNKLPIKGDTSGKTITPT